jgi:hypothetical protein
MFAFPFKLMLITAPLVYWWTGTAVVNADAQDIIYWLGPSVAASVTFMAIYAGNRVMPVMTDVSQPLSAFAIVGTVVMGLAKPWGHRHCQVNWVWSAATARATMRDETAARSALSPPLPGRADQPRGLALPRL